MKGVPVKALARFYEGNYKKYLAVPIALLAITSFLAFVFPGVPFGIDLKGGTLIIIRSENPMDAKKAEQLLNKNFELTDLSVVSTVSPLGYGLTIRFAENTAIAKAEKELWLAKTTLANPTESKKHAQNVVTLLQDYVKPVQLSNEPKKALGQATELLADAKEAFNNKVREIISKEFSLEKNIAFQKKEVSPTLGSAFYKTAFSVAIFSLILVTIVVFAFFRRILPSGAVIASALLDVVGALGLMAVFRIPLTLSSIPALLMLVGYSIDTDVMLTTKLLQRKEQGLSARAHDALITGLTMNATTVAALLAMLSLSYITQMEVVFNIAIVLLFGLITDLSSTWLMNAPVLLWYIERSGQK